MATSIAAAGAVLSLGPLSGAPMPAAISASSAECGLDPSFLCLDSIAVRRLWGFPFKWSLMPRSSVKYLLHGRQKNLPWPGRSSSNTTLHSEYRWISVILLESIDPVCHYKRCRYDYKRIFSRSSIPNNVADTKEQKHWWTQLQTSTRCPRDRTVIQTWLMCGKMKIIKNENNKKQK